MKLGVLSVLLQDLPLREALHIIRGMGAEMVEIGCGGYPGRAHCDPNILLKDEAALKTFAASFLQEQLQISALSCHNNPLHPNREIAAQADTALREAVLLAEKLGVPVVNTFSGCPGGAEGDTQPNWATCAWPQEFTQILQYQWEEKLIPYWKNMNGFAAEHHVKIALEMHPGFCVYGVETLLALRKAAGDNIGANLDPSHLIWQGVDPVAAIVALGKEGAIFHFHAKDTRLNANNIAVNGVLDTKHYNRFLERSWVFCTVGTGMEACTWKNMMAALRAVGYDYCLSIEHEDALMSPREGLAHAVRFLQDIIIREPAGAMYWA